jgi:Protein of unknown function (DUF2723)
MVMDRARMVAKAYGTPAVGILLATSAFVLYALTLAPSVMQGDYAEFQFCAAILGIPHPTGYPLYILLGKLFTMLPVGDVAYRVNLSSAVYMAGAVGVGYGISVQLLRLTGMGRVWWAGVVGMGLFAVAPTPWSMSLVARAYALNALLVASVVFALIAWRGTCNPRWFYASCLLIGLSVVHHGTTYLLLPAYGLYLLLVEWERRTVDGRRWTADGRHAKRETRNASELSSTVHRPPSTVRRLALGVACGLVGLSPLLLLVYRFVWRGPYYWGNPSSWEDFFGLLAGGPFHNQVFGFGTDLGTQWERTLFGIGELSGQYTAVGIAVGLVGIVVLLKYKPVEAGLLLLMMAGNFLFAMNYSIVGYLYFIPTYLIWAVFVSVGAGWAVSTLWKRLEGKVAAAWGWVGLTVGGMALMVAVGWAVGLRYPNIDQSGQTSKRDTALALLNSAPQGASLYLDWEDLSVIRFYRLVYGLRTDLTLHSGDPADWGEGVYCDLEQGSAVYVAPFAGAQPPTVARDFTLEPAPMGWRVTGVANNALYEVPVCGTCATCR